jgi:ABC-type transport system involved in multi-copper enzyme maturation permease subunit
METAISPRSTGTRPVQPSWFGALAGLWSLTWRSQLSLRKLPLLIATLSVIPLLAYLTVDEGRIKPYFHWMIDFYFLLLLPLYCLSVCGGMIRDEVQADTLGFLTTRPMTRAQFFCSRYLCQIAWLQILAGISASLLVTVGIVRDISGITSFIPLLFAGQMLAVLAYGALSSLVGLIHQRYMVLGVMYGFVVEIGIGRIPTNINNLSLSRHLRAILANNSTIRDQYDWSAEGTFFSIAIMLIAAVLFLVIGAIVFTVKEYHHSDEMQK